MRALDEGCAQFPFAICLKHIELINISHAGIQGDQLKPAYGYTIHHHVKGVDVFIAQGLYVDAFAFGRQAVVGGLGLLDRRCFEDVVWDGVDLSGKIQAEYGACANKVM